MATVSSFPTPKWLLWRHVKMIYQEIRPLYFHISRTVLRHPEFKCLLIVQAVVVCLWFIWKKSLFLPEKDYFVIFVLLSWSSSATTLTLFLRDEETTLEWAPMYWFSCGLYPKNFVPLIQCISQSNYCHHNEFMSWFWKPLLQTNMS